jgi:hypothetical protein
MKHAVEMALDGMIHKILSRMVQTLTESMVIL